jgi:hypothetical protein
MQFNILADLMLEGQQKLFTELCKTLKENCTEIADKQKEEEQKEEQRLVRIIILIFSGSLNSFVERSRTGQKT